FAKDATIIYSAVGTVEDMRELVALAAAGKVKSHVSRTGALSELPTIFDELEAARYLGRAVLTDLSRCRAEGAMKDVQGRVAVVTGAASGIGRGMCEAFVEAGMRVVLADVEQKALELTAQTLRAGGADVHGVVTDVSKREQVEALASETLRHFGAVH